MKLSCNSCMSEFASEEMVWVGDKPYCYGCETSVDPMDKLTTARQHIEALLGLLSRLDEDCTNPEPKHRCVYADARKWLEETK